MDPEHFIYILLPGAIQPLERAVRFEDRIEPVLSAQGLGAITGGGSSLSEPQPDGSRRIEFCGIDIESLRRDEALHLLRTLLPTLTVPAGAELHYTRNDAKLMDVLTDAGWVLEQPRSFRRPGFDV